ncbi:TVP38/TMEM64 family protein [Hellea sp.]|nr:TVP38/TMEM64 family protein [Hellea sp.]
MKSVWAFFTQMDKQALRALAVLLVMFGVVILLILIGRDMLSLPESEFHQFFESLRASGYGLPLTILTFVLAAFLGAPQWALIAGVVVAFGPMSGGIYAWIATMVSATIDFWLGRWMGAERLRRYGGEFVNRIVRVVRKNGLVTSFAVRFVPTGPFVLVNMAAGVSHMKFLSFFLGTALGIVPKIAIVALVGQGLISGSEGKAVMGIFIGLAVLLIVFMFLARRRLRAEVALEPKKHSD